MNDLAGYMPQRDDIDLIANLISNDYFDSCQTKNELVAEIQTVLGTSGPISFGMSTPTNKHVSDLDGTASFDASFDLSVQDGETQRTLHREGTFHLKWDGVRNRWQLYGNQDCVHG
jgi:hypothetical protein